MTILSGFKIISQQIYQCNFSSQHAQPPMTNLQWKNVDSCTGVRIKKWQNLFSSWEQKVDYVGGMFDCYEQQIQDGVI